MYRLITTESVCWNSLGSWLLSNSSRLNNSPWKRDLQKSNILTSFSPNKRENPRKELLYHYLTLCFAWLHFLIVLYVNKKKYSTRKFQEIILIKFLWNVDEFLGSEKFFISPFYSFNNFANFSFDHTRVKFFSWHQKTQQTMAANSEFNFTVHFLNRSTWDFFSVTRLVDVNINLKIQNTKRSFM